jgi:hypothetical protein
MNHGKYKMNEFEEYKYLDSLYLKSFGIRPRVSFEIDTNIKLIFTYFM